VVRSSIDPKVEVATPLSGGRFDSCRRLCPFSMAIQFTIRGCATPWDSSIVLWYRFDGDTPSTHCNPDQSPPPLIPSYRSINRLIDCVSPLFSTHSSHPSKSNRSRGYNLVATLRSIPGWLRAVTGRRKCCRKSNFRPLRLGCHGAFDGGSHACRSCRSHLGWS
jgi:hypothetical protein